MGVVRNYEVHLIPAAKKGGMLTFVMFDSRTKIYKVEAASLDALEAEIRRLAQTDFKADCTAVVIVPKGQRKPPGFDQRKYDWSFIDYVIAPAVEASASLADEFMDAGDRAMLHEAPYFGVVTYCDDTDCELRLADGSYVHCIDAEWRAGEFPIDRMMAG